MNGIAILWAVIIIALGIAILGTLVIVILAIAGRLLFANLTEHGAAGESH